MSHEPAQDLGPWNPGLQSALPDEFLPLSTIFHPANVSSGLKDLRGLGDLSGLPIERLATFRPERLAVHEVLIRVMANLTVSDGRKYEDLGVNFRAMTSTIYQSHIAPLMPEIQQVFDEMLREASVFIDHAQREAHVKPDASTKACAPNRWWQVFARDRKSAAKPAVGNPESGDLATIAVWHAKADTAQPPFEQACYKALATVTGAIFAKRGRLFNDRSIVTSLATRLAGNDYGSLLIGQFIEPHFRDAVSAAGYRWLPTQQHPLIMNVKGASASGKSTMRPLQRELAGRLGVDWMDFALISPDIWRKYLLDYAELGPARRYAGTLTGHEIEIIDKKLDRYMSRKAEAGRMSHLLIDRFRFDSFSERPDESGGSRLLTRFGDEIYMFFMITPPEATVERSWKRGEQVGRYKSVEDLLAHNVEAYEGIPGLFFTWVLRPDKKVHFEFLDNSVAEGERPATVAFGVNNVMNILDLQCIFDIDRYRTINIAARTPGAVYPAKIEPPGEFLRQCVRRLPVINFADRKTGEIYARIANGTFTWWDRSIFTNAVPSAASRSAFERVTQPPVANDTSGTRPARLAPHSGPTVGEWL
ncbi:MAG: hypothetical protein ABL901_08800 [Hyphomicrobiaceae bacterium]